MIVYVADVTVETESKQHYMTGAYTTRKAALINALQLAGYKGGNVSKLVVGAAQSVATMYKDYLTMKSPLEKIQQQLHFTSAIKTIKKG